MIANMQKKLIFLSTHYKHRKVQDRVTAAVEAGFSVDLFHFAFSKPELHDKFFECDDVRSIPLAVVPPGSMFRRIVSLARGLFKIYQQTSERDGQESVILCNNFTMLLLARLRWPRATQLIYDIADIHAMQYGNNPIASIIRGIESRLLKRIALLVVSSPWFYSEYYKKTLGYQGRVHLIENRLAKDEVNTDVVCRSEALEEQPIPTPGVHIPTSQPKPIQILFNGLIRCNTSVKCLIETKRSSNNSVVLHFAGDMTLVKASADSITSGESGILISGRYRPMDLGIIFLSADYIWAIDVDDGRNSQWLLPNRLYQAIYFEKPIIALKDTAVGELVELYGVGIVIERCDPSILASKLISVTPREYSNFKQRLETLRPFSIRRKEWQDVLQSFSREGFESQDWTNPIALCLR